jgi:hypothetical protein
MAIFPNLCVPAERDLRFASTGSNYNPRNTSMYSCLPRRSGRSYWGGYNFRLP